MPSNPQVRLAMARIAENLARPGQVGDTLNALTRSARDTIPGADFASITVVRPDGSIETLGATDDRLVELDRVQVELHDGPSFAEATEDEVYISEDLAHDVRWPRYGRHAASLGVGAQMGINLHSPGRNRASLNLYSERTWLFVDAYEVADLFASHASLVLGFASTANDFNDALKSRKVIGQAIGIVMERYAIDEDRAFDFLVRTSKDSNVKLRAIADDIVSGHNARHTLAPLSAGD